MKPVQGAGDNVEYLNAVEGAPGSVNTPAVVTLSHIGVSSADPSGGVILGTVVLLPALTRLLLYQSANSRADDS